MGIFAYEFIENDEDKIFINKNGIVSCPEFIEKYDNLLKVNGDLYTVQNKLTVSKTVNDGNQYLGIHTGDYELMDGIYTMTYCTDTLMGSTHPPAQGYQDIWFYLTKDLYSSKVGSYDTPVCFYNTNSTLKTKVIDGGYKYTFQYTISGYKGLGLRINLSSKDGNTVTSKFWNFKLTKFPDPEKTAFYKDKIETDEIYEI